MYIIMEFWGGGDPSAPPSVCNPASHGSQLPQMIQGCLVD